MAASLELLEKAWQQLEVENPESISRLRQLRVRQGWAEEKKVKNEAQLCLNPSPSSHVEQVFRDLTNSGFALSFGDVTLVFEGGECVPYYKGILSLINNKWSRLLQLCSNTDTVFLVGVSKTDFFNDLEKKPTPTQTKINKVITKSKDIKSKPAAPYNNSLQPKMRNQKKTVKCPECNKLTKGGHLSRHILENHTTMAYECNLCGNKFKRKEHLKIHTEINCRRDPNLFPVTCGCGNTFKTTKKMKNHKSSKRCLSFITRIASKRLVLKS